MSRESSIWIYGSFARGDADSSSDIDILIAGDEEPDWRDAVEADAQLRALIQAGHQLSPMRFSRRELTAMASYGSLFLHHVSLEGRPIGEVGQDWLSTALAGLPPYARAEQEIRSFLTVISDADHSITGAHSPPFELAVIATALRHAFILGCYVTGNPDFGRTTPFRTLASELGLSDQTVSDLGEVYGFRMQQQGRGHAPFDATTDDVLKWLRLADTLLATIRTRVDDFNRSLYRASGGSS